MVEFLFQHYHVTTSFNVPYGIDIKLGHKTLVETKFYSPAVTILLNSPVEAYISALLLYSPRLLNANVGITKLVLQKVFLAIAGQAVRKVKASLGQPAI